jgi:hypothetical protein
MAKRKRKARQVIKTPAKWFRESVKRGQRNEEVEYNERERREREIKYLKGSIQFLRPLVKGFDAKDGYSLDRKKLVRLTGKKLQKLRDISAQFRREMSQPHKVVKVRDKKKIAALEKYTGAKRIVGRKAFVVHVVDPDNTEVKITSSKKGPAHFETIRKFGKSTISERYFLFSDYQKRQPMTMKEIERLVRTKMMPDMPAGFYFFYSKDYGLINGSVERDALVQELQEHWLTYDKFTTRSTTDDRGLAESLLGFRWFKTAGQADDAHKRKDTYRMQYKMHKRRVRETKERTQRRRLTGK